MRGQFLSGLVGGVFLVTGCAKPRTAPAPETKVSKAPDDSSRLAPDVLTRCKDATVLIGDFEGGKLVSTGSGVVLSDGRTVVTNRHVVVGDDGEPDALKLVFFPGTDHARIVRVGADAVSLLSRGDDDKDDVAAIRLRAQIAPPLDLAADDEANETDPVWSLGFPNGLDIRRGDSEGGSGEMPTPTVHAMRIERVERKRGETRVLQLGGSVTYGDSGGPVVSRAGRVLGVAQALADGRSSIVYAVPGAAIRRVVALAKGGGKSDVSEFVADLDAPKPKGPEGDEPPPKPKAPEATDPGPTDATSPVLTGSDLDESDLESLSPVALTVLRNDPFARRGYIFKRVALRKLFSDEPWYVPRTHNLAAVERRFTRRERRNVDLISAYQKAAGKTW